MRRRFCVPVFVVASFLLVPTPAHAAVGCSFAGGTADVSLGDGDSATLSVQAGAIEVDGTACGGATTANTDLVTVTGSGGTNTLTIDVSGGPFAPGATDEPGSSDEIELQVDLGGGQDGLVVAANSENDAFTSGDLGVNLNAAESDGVDADVTLAGVEEVVLAGGAGNDLLSAGGGAGTGGPSTLPTALNGAAGSDRLVNGAGADDFSGGSGWDAVDYSAGTADLTVTIGDGSANDGAAGEGDEVQGDVESVRCGTGDDVVTGDESAELLTGGDGDDHLMGKQGDDELRGESGNDLLEGAGNDDLLIGGPGDDQELGLGANDVFLPNQVTIFENTTPLAIPDTGTVTSILPVPADMTIYDTNARIDVDHPATQHLRITLISPAGERNRLSDHRGNGTPLRGTVFDSEARSNIRHAVSKPFEGRFHPDGTMEMFDSTKALGDWTLEIFDRTGGSVGTLNSWSIQFTFANATSDGNDVQSGGAGGRDLLDWFGRTLPVSVTMMGGADDGQAGELDNVGADLADIEDLYGGVAGDTIHGTDAKNEIRGMIGGDTIVTLGEVDTIRGRQGKDTIDGGAGNDWINAGSQDDTIDGGPGVDAAAYTGAKGNGITADLAAGTVSGGDGNDTLANVESIKGTNFEDVIFGDDGVNLLDGGSGADQIDGRGANDTLEGGPGSDTLEGGAGNDWVRYPKAPSPVTVDLASGSSSGGEGPDTITGVEHVQGSALDDTLTGTNTWNILKGMAGHDSLTALAKNDKLVGGDGNDTLDGGADTDTCLSGETLIDCEL